MKNANQSILNVPISALNYESVSQEIINSAVLNESKSVGVCNVHSVTTCGWDKSLRKALLSNDLNTADGMPLVWMLKLLGHKDASRVYGPTLMIKLLEKANRLGLKIALYGGHEDRLKLLVSKIENQYPNLQIVEAISPPFGDVDPEEMKQHIESLQKSKAHIIFVGLGCPKQEIWMSEYRDQLKSVLIGVGAAFDFHVDAVPQAPSYIQKVGMEWAYRLYQEPKRLFKRYLTTNPVFILRSGMQLLSFYVLKFWKVFIHSNKSKIILN